MNSRRKHHLLRGLAYVLEVPRDIILDLPRITITGNIQVVVGNHRGVVEFRPGLVRLRVNGGELKIHGENLTISSASMEEIVIDGTILKVELPGLEG